MTAIRVRGLRKSYGPLEAVAGIDFDVDAGEVFGFLGPNGAGKTTTVEILEGYRSRSHGEVEVLGHDPASASRDLRERVGIVLQDTGVERYLRVGEVLDLYSGYYAKPRSAGELLELVGLESQRSTMVRRLSGGQRRRLDLALGLVGDPELIFLDEPTTGFDPSARRGAWDVIRNLRTLGRTVFLTTHYMDEAAELADRVAVISGGRIVAEGPPDELGSGPARTDIRFRLPYGSTAGDLPDLGDAVVKVGTEPVDSPVLVSVAEPTAALNLLTGWALERGWVLDDLVVSRPSLEQVYLELTSAAG